MAEYIACSPPKTEPGKPEEITLNVEPTDLDSGAETPPLVSGKGPRYWDEQYDLFPNSPHTSH